MEERQNYLDHIQYQSFFEYPKDKWNNQSSLKTAGIRHNSVVSFDTEKLHRERDNSNCRVWVQHMWAVTNWGWPALGNHWLLGCRPEFSLITKVANNMKSTQLIHTTQSYWRGRFQESRVSVVQLYCVAEWVYLARDSEVLTLTYKFIHLKRWGWEEVRTIK